MTLTPAKAGGWAFDEILTETQMNHLQDELVKAIDGTNGGSYTLVGQLQLSGSEFRLSGITQRLMSTGILSGNVGSQILVRGTLEVESGGVLSVESGGDLNVESGGDLNLLSGADLVVDSGGEIYVDTGGLFRAERLDDLQLIAASRTVRHNMTPVNVPLVSGAQTWVHGNTDRCWTQASVASAYVIRFAIDLGEGDVLNQVRFQLHGDGVGFGSHGSIAGMTKPVVRLVQVDPNSGAATVLASLTDPSASVGAYEVNHNVSLNSSSHPGVFPYTGNSSLLYAEVAGETGTNSQAQSLCIYGIVCEQSLNSLKARFTVGS